jgi:hypothetical protein
MKESVHPETRQDKANKDPPPYLIILYGKYRRSLLYELLLLPLPFDEVEKAAAILENVWQKVRVSLIMKAVWWWWWWWCRGSRKVGLSQE